MISYYRIYDSENWISDIDKVSSVIPELDRLCGRSVLITGASGLICSSVADILIRYNETHTDKIFIYLAGRSIERMKQRFGSFLEKEYVSFIQYDATSEDNIFDRKFDYIIHGASNASPKIIMNEPAETMVGNFCGAYQLLNYAHENSVKRILYVSSSEVYGISDHNKPLAEDSYGYIDILNPRSSYSIGKIATETLFACYNSEYDIDSVIVRPGHIYGPTASETDSRVASAFVYGAIRGEDIILKSDGSQVRSYCYCLDCASAIIKVLLNGSSMKAYNISNHDSYLSILDLSKKISTVSGVNLIMDVPEENEKKSFNPMKNSTLNSDRLEALGWKALFDPDTGLKHTYDTLKYILSE